MNTRTMWKRVTTAINCWKTYAALALAAPLALFSGAATAEKAAEPPRHPAAPMFDEGAAQTMDKELEELEQKPEVVERESPEESVRLLMQDRFAHFFAGSVLRSNFFAWEPRMRGFEREPRVVKLLDLARNGSEEQRASLLAEVKKMCRYFIEELRMVSESPDDILPSVIAPAGALAYPLLLSELDDKAETLPLIVEMWTWHLKVYRKLRAEGIHEAPWGVVDEKAGQTREIEKAPLPVDTEKLWVNLDFGQVLAYACVELLSKYERSPALRAALSARQAQILADFVECKNKNEFYNREPKLTQGFNYVMTFKVAQDFVQAADK